MTELGRYAIGRYGFDITYNGFVWSVGFDSAAYVKLIERWICFVWV